MSRTKKNITDKPSTQEQVSSQKPPAIIGVRQKVTSFLGDALMVKSIKIVKTLKTEDGWEALAEVYEDSAFIKELGLQTRVKDKNLYEVKLADDLEITAFEKISTLE